MKRILRLRGGAFLISILLILVALSLTLVTGCDDDDDDDDNDNKDTSFYTQINKKFASNTSEVEKIFQEVDEVTPNDYNTAVGFQYAKTNKIVFIFSPKRFEMTDSDIAKITKVNMEGSFNGWKKFGTDETSYELVKRIINNTVYFLSEPISANLLKRPGDTGISEFKFGVTYNDKTSGNNKNGTSEYPESTGVIDGFQIATNHNLMIIDGVAAMADVKGYDQIAGQVKKLKDFKLDNIDYTKDDLTGEYTWQELTNVRYVPGCGTNLVRGYHPWKMSRVKQKYLDKGIDTDPERSKRVKEAIEARRIKTIVTLSDSGADGPLNAADDSNNNTTTDEKSSDYVEAIKTAGNWYTYDPDGNKTGDKANLTGHYSDDKLNYNMVFYGDENDKGRTFTDIFADIVRFMIARDGPYYVHCRLGSDRTGVTNATLAALAGAKWGDIRHDFERTNHMGINEFRGYRLLAYAFTSRIPTLVLTDDKVFSSELRTYFKTKSNYADESSTPLTDAELDTLVSKLTAK